MSFLRRRERRRGKAATAAMTVAVLGVFQVLAIIGAGSALAAATCTYNPATDTINITLPVPADSAFVAVEDDAVGLDAESTTGAILFVPSGAWPPVYENGVNSGQCGSATNANTVAIVVLGSPNGAEFFGIDNFSGGEFNSSIAWSIDMGGQPAATTDQFEIEGSDATDDEIAVTDTSFTLNGAVGELVGVEDIELFGNDGDDTLDASGMSASVVSLALNGGLGDDWIAPGAFDGDVAAGGAGTDWLSYATRTTCTIIDNTVPEAGQDSNCDGDLIDAADENDTVTGFEILESGSGNDILVGSGAVTETFIPGDGDDDVTGQAVDTIDWSSSSAAMTIDPALGEAVGQGTDTFAGPLNYVGSAFDDVLIWDGTTLSFSGGTGTDTVDASAETSGVAINLDALDPASDDLENAIGGSGGDTLLGNDLRNVLWGNDGDDSLSGFAGNDTFFGGLGNDTFTGGDGADTVDFGASPNGIDADVSLGFATGEGDDAIAGIEIVKGSAFNDSIVGGGGVTAANFRITGRAGNDILTGSGSNDFLKGGAGNDRLRGLEGGDTLIGGKGTKDKAWGGPGTDVCKAEYEKSCEI